MNTTDPILSGSSFAELYQQLAVTVTQTLLISLVVVGATAVILVLLSCSDAMRARRRQALVQEHLRQSGATPALKVHGPETVSVPENHRHVWRIQILHWKFALSVDHLERTA